MLAYAAGRELTASDEFLIKSITADLEKNDYKFSALVTEIVRSDPFRMRRGKNQ